MATSPRETTRLLQSPMLGGTGAPPSPVPRSPAAVYIPKPQVAGVPSMPTSRASATLGPASAAPPDAMPPEGLAGILETLTRLGAAPSAAASPVAAPAPSAGQRARPLRAAMKKMITRALDEKPDRLLYFSASDLDLLGVDEATLHDLLDQLDLAAAEDADSKGGVIIAESVDLLEERMSQRGQGIRIYWVLKHERAAGRL
jgi:hypothetical protein